MKKDLKKLLSLFMAIVILLSVASVSLFSATAKVNPDGTYTPGQDVITNNIMLAMPGLWKNEITATQDEACGCYWWGGTDIPYSQPELVRDWPGYKMNRVQEDGVDNLYSISVPVDVPMIIFNNYIDGGMNPSAPEFKAACQNVDTQAESYAEGDSDYYPQYFWDYINENYDDFDFSDFGVYEDNFYDDILYGNGIVHSVNNMVYVVDLRAEYMVISTVLVPEGKPTYEGAFYFYYGNGQYGIWPTIELAAEQEGLEFDENGILIPSKDYNYDRYGNIVRTAEDYLGYEKVFTVFGNFTEEGYADSDPDVVIDDPVNPDNPATKDSFDWEQKDNNKIYFYADPDMWRNYKNVTVYMYEHGGDELITWGSRKGVMTDEGGNIWSYDLEEKGLLSQIDDDSQYGVIFTADWGAQTCDLIFGRECLGDLAFMTGEIVENTVDSNKSSKYTLWANQDRTKFAPPLEITSIGNVVGEVPWADTTPREMFVEFLLNENYNGLSNALKYRPDVTAEELATDVGLSLGLSEREVSEIISEVGLDDPYYDELDSIAELIESYYYFSPQLVIPLAKEFMEEADVTADEVLERIYERGMVDYSAFKEISDLLSNADSNTVRGDFNGDGEITIDDATDIQLFLVGR